MKKLYAIYIIIGLIISTFSANAVLPADSAIKKKGWTFGALPVVAYDSDVGLRYGALANFYNYGDGKLYPHYHHSLYFEWSRTTKGSGLDQFVYDSEHLIPGIRIFSELSRLTEQALNFYGFNGYEAWYNPDYEDQDHTEYISRVFYRMDRTIYRVKADFQGALFEKTVPGKKAKWQWLAGFETCVTSIGSVNIDKLNKGKDPDEMLPDTALLYDKFVDWGLISGKQTDGGTNTIIKLGMVYDTRNLEAMPTSGIWTDVQVIASPAFLGNDGLSYLKLALNYRQYFSLIRDKLSLAYRLGIQSKIAGEIPFYMISNYYSPAPAITRDGLGGAKTLRGILRNRVTGDGMANLNTEIRWKVINTRIKRQNFYAALSAFGDLGMVVQPYQLPDIENLSLTPEQKLEVQAFTSAGKEKPHVSIGAGLHLALNENFVVAFDYGIALDRRDGKNGLYIALGWLY